MIRKMFEAGFLRDISETVATRLVLIVLGLITSVLVARLLGPEGRGLFAIAAAIGAVGIQLGNAGIHSSNTYYVAQNRALLPTLLGNSLLISLGMGISLIGVTAVTFTFYPQIAPLEGALLWFAFLWIPLGLFYLLLQNLLIGLEQFRYYNITEIVTKVLYGVFIALLIWLHQVVVEWVYLAFMIAGVVGIIVLWRKLMLESGPVNYSWSIFRQSLSFGVRAYLVALFSFLVMRIDLFMVEGILGLEATGHYSIAVTLADYVYMIPVVVGTILFPKLSAMQSKQEKWHFTKKLLFWFTPFIALISFLAALLADPLIRLLFGNAFVPAVEAFIWLLPAIIFLSINTVFMNYFASLGMPLITLYSTVFATGVNVLGNWWLLPELGIAGASIASMIAYGIMLLISIYYILYKKPYQEAEV
jgi:O-antigen/teichoic acid export membrane protein